jgi:hypothetical protein
MELSKIGYLPVCPLRTRLLTHSSVRLALWRSLNFNNPRVSSGKLSSLSLLNFWRYSARQKLINSSVGKPVSFDHHERVLAFSGVRAMAVFTVSSSWEQELGELGAGDGRKSGDRQLQTQYLFVVCLGRGCPLARAKRAMERLDFGPGDLCSRVATIYTLAFASVSSRFFICADSAGMRARRASSESRK